MLFIPEFEVWNLWDALKKTTEQIVKWKVCTTNRMLASAAAPLICWWSPQHRGLLVNVLFTKLRVDLFYPLRLQSNFDNFDSNFHKDDLRKNSTHNILTNFLKLFFILSVQKSNRKNDKVKHSFYGVLVKIRAASQVRCR